MYNREAFKDLLDEINSTRDKPVQLVKHIGEVPEKQLKYPAVAQEKYDGVWCGILVKDGEYAFITRTGRFMYYELYEGYKLPAQAPDGLYIGELICPALTLEELSGAVNPNRVEQWTSKVSTAMQRSAKVMLHDCISLKDFERGFSDSIYFDRNVLLFNAIDKCSGCIGIPLEFVTSVNVNTYQEFEAYSSSIIARGGEGAVRKDVMQDWVAGHKGYRVTKLVRGVDLDLRCIGFAFGKGKREGQIATLRFSYKGKEFNADLGKGWTDATRDGLTKEARIEGNEGYPIGSIFHVHGLQISSKGVIRLPKVMEERVDKLIPDA